MAQLSTSACFLKPQSGDLGTPGCHTDRQDGDVTSGGVERVVLINTKFHLATLVLEIIE